MLLSSLSLILASALAASAAPAADPARPNGDAWAEVTQCAYSVSLGYPTGDPNNALRWDPPITYIGTILQYYTWDGWSSTTYSSLSKVESNQYWADSYKPYCSKVNGYDYCFSGTFQKTIANPNPKLYVWGPNTLNSHVQLPTSPSKTAEPKNNGKQSLCLQKWPILSVGTERAPPGGAIGRGVCSTDWKGNPLPQCPLALSQTNSYYNQPYTL